MATAKPGNKRFVWSGNNTTRNQFFKKIAFIDQTLTSIAPKANPWNQSQGDCEEYVIAKYFTLLELGVDKNKIRTIHDKVYKPNVVSMALDNLLTTMTASKSYQRICSVS